jgi:hypothetical protein
MLSGSLEMGEAAHLGLGDLVGLVEDLEIPSTTSANNSAPQRSAAYCRDARVQHVDDRARTAGGPRGDLETAQVL